MEHSKFCQSCTFPIDDAEDHGTEKDGTKSDIYCKYCYQNGSFTDPNITMERMTEIIQTEMGKRNIPGNIIQEAIRMLPNLKRWQTQPSV